MTILDLVAKKFSGRARKVITRSPVTKPITDADIKRIQRAQAKRARKK